MKEKSALRLLSVDTRGATRAAIVRRTVRINTDSPEGCCVAAEQLRGLSAVKLDSAIDNTD